MTEDDVAAGLAALTGVIEQVPSAVSAVKVDGQRAYARVRAGEPVELAARHGDRVPAGAASAGRRPTADLLDLDVEVDCSSGTYVRALARDLGAALGIGGHLTALRRTRVGPFTLADAVTLERAGRAGRPGADPAGRGGRRRLPAPRADRGRGRPARGTAAGWTPLGRPGPYGAFDPDGHAVALVEDRADAARPLVVFRPA